MTPKQAAAKLLHNAMTKGAKHPKQMDRIEMGTTLDMRISDEKREKILGFVEKIEAPYLERLVRLSGEGGDEAPAAEGQAAAPSA